MHEPKFTKKCYDCTNRFICWTNREELPEIVGLPTCEKCGTQLRIIGNPYERRLGDGETKILVVKAKCPERRFFFSFHSSGRYMKLPSGRWSYMRL